MSARGPPQPHTERPAPSVTQPSRPPSPAAWREMSAGGQRTGSREIPAVRRVAVLDAAHMPQDYSSTPGGTVFSTTPGGTRIIYDRKFLLQCRTSPLTRTPPNLPDIPGVTRPLKRESSSETNEPERPASNNTDRSQHTESAGEDAQFEMDI